MRSLLLAVIVTFSATCQAAACPEHFFNGQPPAITNEALRARATELCFEGFAVLYSGTTRTPLYSAEHLTRQRLDAAATLPRVNSFHPEPRLSTGDRATLTDYKASGYDRGHMAPNGDMPTTGAQQESFSLANMIPQSKRINEGVWEGIETAVRNAVERGEGAYLITGPLFEGKTLQQINDRVLVPTAVFKMVYFPDKHRGAAYVATNDRDADTHDYDVVSVADLEKRIGINLLPGVPDSVKAVRAELPSPEIRGHGKSKAKSRRAHRSTWIVQ